MQLNMLEPGEADTLRALLKKATQSALFNREERALAMRLIDAIDLSGSHELRDPDSLQAELQYWHDEQAGA